MSFTETPSPPNPNKQQIIHESSMKINSQISTSFAFPADDPLAIANTSPQLTFLRTAQSGQQTSRHQLFYVGSVLLVLGFYLLLICLCKWRKDRNNKKPVKNELIEEKEEKEEKTQDYSNETPKSGNSSNYGHSKEIELVQMP